jgi:hypothetical protein
MIRDSTGRERGANPNARSAHAARHIYIYIYNNNPNARSAHAARHIYIYIYINSNNPNARSAHAARTASELTSNSLLRRFASQAWRRGVAGSESSSDHSASTKCGLRTVLLATRYSLACVSYAAGIMKSESKQIALSTWTLVSTIHFRSMM